MTLPQTKKNHKDQAHLAFCRATENMFWYKECCVFLLELKLAFKHWQCWFNTEPFLLGFFIFSVFCLAYEIYLIRISVYSKKMVNTTLLITMVCLGSCLISTMELFTEIVTTPFTIFPKNSVIGIWQGPKYAQKHSSRCVL